MTTRLKTRDAFYGEAVARAHAEAFSQQFETGFDWLAKQIKSAPGPARLFDIGCGDGRWLEAALSMNIAGEGIDISPDFVTMARARGLNVGLESAALARPPAGTNALTALGEVLAYLPAALAPCALNAARALPKGGVFIFDLPGPDIPQGSHETPGAGWTLRTNTRIKGNILTRSISVTGATGTQEEIHRQRLFEPAEVCGILSGFGFAAEILGSYGPGAFLPGRFGVLARKI